MWGKVNGSHYNYSQFDANKNLFLFISWTYKIGLFFLKKMNLLKNLRGQNNETTALPY